MTDALTKAQAAFWEVFWSGEAWTLDEKINRAVEAACRAYGGTGAPARKPRAGKKPLILGERAEEVRALVAEGLNDIEIAARFNCRPHVVTQYRRRHGIDKGPRTERWNYAKDQTPAPRVEVTTYVDDDGRRITRVPPGYARGAEPSSTGDGYSAKPKGARRKRTE